MLKKTLTAAVAALTLATAVTPAPAQAGSLGKVVAVGILGAAVGAIVGAAGSKAAHSEEYEPREARRFRPSSCDMRRLPVFDRDGQQVGWRHVPAC